MSKTTELMDAIKGKYELTSNYQLSKKIEVSEQAISLCYKHVKNADEYIAARLAKELELEPWGVLVEIKAESEKNPKKREFWKGFLKTTSTSAVLVISAAVVNFSTPTPLQAAPVLEIDQATLCIMSTCRVWRRRLRIDKCFQVKPVLQAIKEAFLALFDPRLNQMQAI